VYMRKRIRIRIKYISLRWLLYRVTIIHEYHE
jgi:hypothetical protein